jgi:hypothetical protein
MGTGPEPRTDDDGTVRGGRAEPTRTAPATPATRAKKPRSALLAIAVALPFALVAGAAAGHGGWPIGPWIAVPSAILVGACAFGGVYALVRGQTLGGVIVVLGAVGMTLYCIVTGVVMRAAAPYLAQTTLEPLVVADRTYLRDPSSGFLIGDPGEGWRENNALAGVLRLSWSLVGETRGAWGWSDDEHGAWLVVLHVHLPATDASVGAVRGMLTGIVDGSVRENGHAEPTEPETPLVRDDARREVWVHAVGSRGGGPVASTARALMWSPEGGGLDALIVTVSSHPDDAWTSFLLDMHAPNEAWQGPGGAPPGFVPAAATLDDARAAYATQLTQTLHTGSRALPAPLDRRFEITNYPSPEGPIAAYATVPLATPPCAGLLWVNQQGTIEDELRPDWPPMRAAVLGAAVLVPTLRGEATNPGALDAFGGGVDDVAAALRVLVGRSGVPASRIVVSGIGAGGTLTLLLAERDEAAAFVPFGAADDTLTSSLDGPFSDGDTAFDPRRVEETWIRSPIHFLGGIRSPTYAVWAADTERTLASRAIGDRLAPGGRARVIDLLGHTNEAVATTILEEVIDAVCNDRPPMLDASVLQSQLPRETLPPP